MTRAADSHRLLLLIPNLGAAGAESQLRHLAQGLARRGHRVTVVAIMRVTTDLEPFRRAGVRVIDLGVRSRRGRALAVPRLARLAREADVVHCGLWDASLWGRLAAMLARRPVVVAEHTPGRHLEVSRSGAPRGRVIALHNRLLDRFTFATVIVGRWQAALLEREGVDPAKIVHIPNGVPIDELREAARRGPARAELGIPERAKVVVHVARLEPQKNQRATLELVARLRGELGDVRALIVGEGPERPALERHAHELGADWATFLGHRDDVAGIFAVADVVVLPSLAEGMPMAILEAIAVGAPIVATDVGDVRAVLEDTGAGLCVDAGDPEELYAACLRVLSDPALREQLERRSREARQLDAETMVDRYEALFEAAIRRQPPRTAVPLRVEAPRSAAAGTGA